LPEASAVVVTVAVPLNATVAPLPPVPLMLPEMLYVCAAEVKLIDVRLLPLIVTLVLVGLKVNPDLLGVTV
jgi:hypothetical protein